MSRLSMSPSGGNKVWIDLSGGEDIAVSIPIRDDLVVRVSIGGTNIWVCLSSGEDMAVSIAIRDVKMRVSIRGNIWVNLSGGEDIVVSIAIGDDVAVRVSIRGSTLPRSFPCRELLTKDLLMIDGFHP